MHGYRPPQDGGVVAAPEALPAVSPPAPEARPAQLGWLLFWMSGTLTAFIIAALSARALSHSLNAFETMTIRSAGGLIILFAMGLASPALLRSIRWRHMRLQFGRNVAHFGSQICWTVGIAVLPFATVFALEFIIPAWVTLLAVLFLGERMTTTRASALAVCFVGVVVILRPGHEAFHPVALLLVLGALLFAIAAVITKKLIVTDRRSRSCSDEPDATSDEFCRQQRLHFLPRSMSPRAALRRRHHGRRPRDPLCLANVPPRRRDGRIRWISCVCRWSR
jgi:hypothetical protein